MIGTKIRGFRHLFRVMKTLQEATFFFKHSNLAVGGGIALYIDGSKYANPFMSSSGDYLILFNDCFDNCKHEKLDYFSKTDINDKIQELHNRFYHFWVVPMGKSRFREESEYFSDLSVMPSDFDKQYADFCNANKKQIPNVTRYSDANCSLFKYIFAISSGSKNFYFWAINTFYKNNTSIYLIEHILKWNDKYNQLQSKLKKGTITAYTSNSDLFGLVHEMTILRRAKRASDVINSFNTAQKKILRATTLTDRDYDTLSKFGKLSQKKKSNFIRKMSTIEDPAEILRQMSFLADIHFEWNKESFLDYYKNLENLNCELVLEKGNMVLLKVKDYEAVKRLAKATNWCISKDKKYWNEYVEMNPQATQYVLFDFSRKEDDNLSIVGFTSVHDRGITHAHDFQNRNIMGSRRSQAVSEIKSFVAKYADCGNIYSVLDKYGISLSDVVSYEPNQYKWGRDTFFEYLHRCIDDEDYYIVFDNGKKVVLIAENDDVRYLLGDAYIDNRHVDSQPGDEHIIFADFTRKQNDPDKLIFGVIHHNPSTHESSCNRLYNNRFEQIQQTFDSKLEEYGLPYDTICRTDNIVDRFYSAFAGYELSTVKDLLKSKEVKDDIKKRGRANILRDALINATFGCTSFDYLNAIYDSGCTVSSLIGERYASDFGVRILNTMCDFRGNPDVPSTKDIENFRNETVDGYGNAMYIGYFLMLMKFIDNEKDQNTFGRIITSIMERRRRSDLFDLVITRLCDKVDFIKDEGDMLAKSIINYMIMSKSNVVFNVLSKKKMNTYLQQYFDGFGVKAKVKSTEIWVKRDENTYVLENINEEDIAHAPRRR